jgi:short subunit dehydrogenase-like uncharacterized protein
MLRKDSQKLAILLGELEAIQKDNLPQVKVVQVSEKKALEDVVKTAGIVVNCVGPFRFYGKFMILFLKWFTFRKMMDKLPHHI